MDMMSKIGYFVKESIASSKANVGTTIGGVVTIFLSLLMVGVSILFSVMISNVTSSFENEVNIRLYIADSASDEDIASFTQYLESMKGEGNVHSIRFMNKDQVLEEFKSSTSDSADIVDQLESNPLPRTYVIEMVNAQQVQGTAQAIQNNDQFIKICDNPSNPADSIKYGQGTVERLFQVVNIIRFACIVVILLLVFISLVFLNNTIRLAILARRREISIMRLVGASNGFIRGPFIMEGALQAIVGALLSIIVIAILSVTLVPALEHNVSFLNLAVASGAYGLIYLLLIFLGVAVGVLGSVIAMRRYLKV